VAKLLCCQQKRNFFWHFMHPRKMIKPPFFAMEAKKETVVGLLVMLV